MYVFTRDRVILAAWLVWQLCCGNSISLYNPRASFSSHYTPAPASPVVSFGPLSTWKLHHGHGHCVASALCNPGGGRHLLHVGDWGPSLCLWPVLRCWHQWQVSAVAGDAGAGHLCPSACANTGSFPSEESPGHMFRLPIVCSETVQHHAPGVCRAAHDSDEGEKQHQTVLIIRKSGHIRAVTRCHEDVTTLSCGHWHTPEITLNKCHLRSKNCKIILARDNFSLSCVQSVTCNEELPSVPMFIVHMCRMSQRWWQFNNSQNCDSYRLLFTYSSLRRAPRFTFFKIYFFNIQFVQFLSNPSVPRINDYACWDLCDVSWVLTFLSWHAT